MLAGSWIGANESDTWVVERLSRKDYRDIETLLQSAEIPEGPWIHRGVECRVIVQLTSNRAEITTDLANRSACVRILKQPENYRF